MTTSHLAVDLAAIARNVERMRERGGGRDVFAAVKADAYGHGMVPVARHIEPLVTGFGVATVGEGRTLRDAGITKPILKLSPALPPELPGALDCGISLTIGALANIDEAATVAREAGTVARVHLNVDTGMRRVGVRPDDAVAAAQRIAAAPELELEGIFTHFVDADTEEGRAFTHQQIAAFRLAVDEVVAAVGPPRWVHSANSAGILNHDLTGDTAVRPGIALYGSAPELNLADDLLDPVARWTSRVILVKPVRAGESVSYGRTWTAPDDTFIATVAVGYGDGYSRLNSNRGRVLIAGVSYPVVGRVCMDQIMVDLGARTDVVAGDEVVLMGGSGADRITPQELADLMGTIPYEVTCLITQRVRRSYTA